MFILKNQPVDLQSQCQIPILYCIIILFNPSLIFHVSELQKKLEVTLMEKNQAVADLEAVRDQLRLTREEVS